MASKSHNKFKSQYQGQNVRRLPRSELEDNTMRDLNRFDNRLDHSLKSVDKARDVVLKALDSDRHIFLKGGVRSNKKYSVQVQNPGDTRQRREVTSQPAKYQPDTRNKKPPNDTGTTHQSLTGNDVRHSTNKQNGDPIQSKHRDILAETRDIIDQQSGGDQLVDDFLSNHRGVDSVGDRKKSAKSSERSSYRTNPIETGLESSQSPYSNSGRPGPRSSTTPTIKVDDYDVLHMSSGLGVEKMTVPKDSMRKQSGASFQTYPPPEEYYSYGRKPGFWEYISTPKNPSRSLQKREQLEREFSSPALKTRATTPAAKSAKGPRTPIVSTTPSNGQAMSMTPTVKSPTVPRVKSAGQKKTSPSSSLKISTKNSIKSKDK